jgi:TPR repeat protein
MDAESDPESDRLFDLAEKLDQQGRYHLAWRALLRAARRGNSSAQNNLGVMYSYGQGVPRSLSKARYWLRKALRPDRNGGVAKNIGLIYQDARRFLRAQHWLEKAVSLGDDDARLHLGWLHLALYVDTRRARDQFHALAVSDAACEAGTEAGRIWCAAVESMEALRDETL